MERTYADALKRGDGAAPTPKPKEEVKKLEEWTNRHDHCCSLTTPQTWLNNMWTWSSPPEEDTSSSGSRMPLPQGFIKLYTDLPSKPIVTIQMSEISSQDAPLHPFDWAWGMIPGTDNLAKLNWTRSCPFFMCTNTYNEEIYVTEQEYHAVLVFWSDGSFRRRIGDGHGSKEGCMDHPSGVAIDCGGDRLYVSDTYNHRVQVFQGSSGDFLMAIGGSGRKTGKLKYPAGVSVSNDGCLVAVADAGNHRVQLFSSTGCVLRALRVSGYPLTLHLEDFFHSPRGICFDNSGDFIYFTDWTLGRLFRVNLNLTEPKCIVSEDHLSRPNGIDIDPVGNLLVCDTDGNEVKVFRPDGQLLHKMDRIGEFEFRSPLDVAVLQGGFLAVLNSKGRIQIF